MILILDNIFPEEDLIQYLKYAVMITLSIFSFKVRKKYVEQKIMALSFLFLLIADFFFGISSIIGYSKVELSALGIGGFILAYLCLIYAYHKNFKIGKAEIITAIPITLIGLFVFFSLRTYILGPVLIETIIFGFMLCYMTWSAVCTIFRGYFQTKAAYLIAISGILMFICDIGVGFSIFHPSCSGLRVSWLKNIIWGTYIPGWTLLSVIISERNLRQGSIG